MSGKVSLLTTVSLSVLALCVSSATAADRNLPVAHARGTVHRVISAVPGAVTLYDQNDDDAGLGALSVNFNSDFDSFDSYGADDFAVPAGHKWKIRAVEVSGYYRENSEPARSENVLFYRSERGFPGRLIAKCDEVTGKDQGGSFLITLRKSCTVNLSGGHRYWVSVVANESNPSTFWYWETRNGQIGHPAAWENPNGGFRRCLTWDVMTSCIGDYGEGPDFMFTLKGKDVVQ